MRRSGVRSPSAPPFQINRLEKNTLSGHDRPETGGTAIKGLDPGHRQNRHPGHKDIIGCSLGKILVRQRGQGQEDPSDERLHSQDFPGDVEAGPGYARLRRKALPFGRVAWPT